MCAYRVVKDVTFPENFAYVVNEWPPHRYWDFCTKKSRNKKSKNKCRRNNETFFLEFSFWGFFVVSYFPLKDMINVTYFILKLNDNRTVPPQTFIPDSYPRRYPLTFTTESFPPVIHYQGHLSPGFLLLYTVFFKL